MLKSAFCNQEKLGKTRIFFQWLTQIFPRRVLSAAISLYSGMTNKHFVGKLFIAQSNLRILAQVTEMSHLLGVHG